MKYIINKSNYRDFNTFADNRLPHRSYFIPFKSRATLNNTSFFDEREKSDCVTMLSGEWDFKYYKHASGLKAKLDTDKINFDKVHVPSTWQKTGYDKINYLNSMYPFACRPPKTPKNCPVGVYRKKFNFSKIEKSNYIITFLGAIASLDVYLNGEYIGYGEGAHNTREFDITEKLVNGENELVAVVYKWSTGTYLECQDMFRENGIFRDVYITELPESYIYDFKFSAEKHGSVYNFSVKTDVKGKSALKVTAELLINGDIVTMQTVNAGERIFAENLSVIEWNAEMPTCYDLYLTLSEDDGKVLQCVRQKIGFRTIEIDGCKYLFNGKLIKLKGVNHHDTHPTRGYAMTADDLKRDVELMKEFNVNCVRTSHYPPDPLFLTLCDVYGLYVVDEADIETHGTFITGNSDLISDNPKWVNHYLDRVQALYERDKNHSSVVMWSLGNEAGGIKNFDSCYEYLKTVTEVPVHYEPACRSKRVRYDILAHFYTSPESMRELARGEWEGEKNYDAPFFLCEYAHSMGVGPGGLDEYWDVIYSDDRFLGGCIWEWADHAHYDENGKYKWTYGGDHKDRRNSGNFCCDGLFYPDRKPSTSAYCMKNVYSPLKAELKDGKLFVKNTNRFMTSEGVTISYYLLKNGETEGLTDLNVIIQPEQSAELPMNFVVTDNDDAFVIIKYISENGAELGREQIVINEAFAPCTVKRNAVKWNVSKKEACADGGFKFNKDGKLIALKDKNGADILAGFDGFMPRLYEAAVDNFVYLDKAAKKSGVNKLYADGYRREVNEFKNTVTSKFYLKSGNKKMFKCETVQKVNSENEVYVTFNLTSLSKKPLDLFRIGLNLALNSEYKNVKYYGMGEFESYSDFNAQDVMGVYETDVKSMFTPYIKPQESGDRSEVRWAEITNDKGSGVRVTALEKAISFKATDVDNPALQKAKHLEDVVHTDKTILHINGFTRGIGSESCGPDTAEEFKKVLYLGETYKYSFKIEII